MEIQPKASSSSIARRSLSIFSRKGHEAASPNTTHSLALASFALATPSTPTATFVQTKSPIKSGSKKWKMKKPAAQQGTILRAVPQEIKTPPLTLLEIEMHTSPNDEILRSIGLVPEDTPVQTPTSPSAISFPKVVDSPTSSRRLSRRIRSDSENSIIGVWKDGTVHWESGFQGTPDLLPAASISAVMEIPVAFEPVEEGSRSKPKIQVIIPKGSSKRLTTPTRLPSPLHEVEQESSGHLKAPSKHQRAGSGSSLSAYSNYSEEDRDSSAGRASSRSSMTSLDSEVEISIEESQKATAPSEDQALVSPLQESEEQFPVMQEQNMPSLAELVDLLRTPSTRAPHRARALSGSVHAMSPLRENEEEEYQPRSPSPTLSEAERNLVKHLSSLSFEDWQLGSLQRSASVPRKPAPPPKSAKRLSRVQSQQSTASPQVRNLARSVSSPTALPPPSPTRAAPSPPKTKKPASRPAQPQQLRRSSSVRSCLSLIDEEGDRQITPSEAEQVVYQIFSNIQNLDDLFNSATMNRAFYRVFKHNELDIMQIVLKNMSPAAWEFKRSALFYDDEDPDSAIQAPEYTSTTYFSSYMRDTLVLSKIKSLILKHCQSIIRTSTEAQLAKHHPLQSSMVDDALWRIWTFCKIFGCGKGREEDVTTQIDWLRGGVVAHNTEAESSFSSHDPWFASSAMLNTPEHFAKGNEDGLSAEQLYDMLELWNCLRSISHIIIGKTELARQYGVYDETEIRGGDIDGEEIMLEEWHNYLLTLGLSVVLQVSEMKSPEATFELAKKNQWTRWAAPVPGSTTRCNFLREAVSRLYEERICETFSPTQTRSREMRELRRRRGSSLAVELKTRKANPQARFPLVTVERPISRANTILDYLSTPISARPPSPQPPPLRSHRMSVSSAPAQFLHDTSTFSPVDVHPLFRNSSSAAPAPEDIQPLYRSTTPVNLSPMDVHPLLRSTTPTSIPPSPLLTVPSPQMGHGFQTVMGNPDPAVLSSEKAIFRITEMGFTVDQAKGALKITDMGDGLRVDRAVEYLLRQPEGCY